MRLLVRFLVTTAAACAGTFLGLVVFLRVFVELLIRAERSVVADEARLHARARGL